MEIANRPNVAIIGCKEANVYLFLKVRGENRAEFLLFMIAIEQLCVYTVYNCRCHSELTFMVCRPSHIVPRVFCQKSEFTCSKIQTIRVKDFRIALVETYDHFVANVFKFVNNRSAHTWEVGVGAFI